MPEHMQNAAENIREQSRVSTQMNKLFGRQKSIHKMLAADVLLWKNKKISSTVLTGATATWVLFEWLQYDMLTISCFALVIGMLIQFLWSKASDMLSRSPSQLPRLVLPEELFIKIDVFIGSQINQFLGFIQDVVCGRNLRQFLVVAVSLWVAAVIGSWYNFLTVLYIGFVCAQTLPVLYETYEEQVDDFLYQLIGELQNRYRKVDASVLSKKPVGKQESWKNE